MQMRTLFEKLKTLFKKPRHFLLGIDRIISGNWLKQLGVATVIFFGVFLFVVIFYRIFKSDGWNSIAEAFVDLVSPVSAWHDTYQGSPSVFSFLVYSFVYFLGVVVFSGLFVATITNILRTRADRFRMGTVTYHFTKKHIVFLGYDDMIVGMILKLCEERKGKVRIVVGVEDNVYEINDKIKNRLYGKYKDNVVVLQADGCNRTDLEKRIRVPHAERVYIIGEHDDAYNLRSYRTIYELSLCSKKKDFDERMPQCYVNLRHKSTLTLFQTYATVGDIGVDFSKFHVFNFYDEWARNMIVGEKLGEESRIDRGGNLEENVHLVIVGMTEMGIALARQAMLWCHYPNDIKTTITFIDPQADLYSKFFIGSHQHLFKECHYTLFNISDNNKEKNEDSKLDIEFEFYRAYISDDDIRGKIVDWVNDEQQLLTIAICLPKAAQSFGAAIYLPEKLFENTNIPIWVYQPTYGDMGNYLSGSRYKNVITFGMSGESLDICNDKIIDKAKKINHYFRNHKKEGKEVSVNYDNARWIDAEWQSNDIHKKWMCINRAGSIGAMQGKVNKNFDRIEFANVEIKRRIIEKLVVPYISSDKNDKENDYVDDMYNINEDYIKRFFETIKEIENLKTT